jgi:hypothetical protein
MKWLHDELGSALCGGALTRYPDRGFQRVLPGREVYAGRQASPPGKRVREPLECQRLGELFQRQRVQAAGGIAKLLQDLRLALSASAVEHAEPQAVRPARRDEGGQVIPFCHPVEQVTWPGQLMRQFRTPLRCNPVRLADIAVDRARSLIAEYPGVGPLGARWPSCSDAVAIAQVLLDPVLANERHDGAWDPAKRQWIEVSSQQGTR